MMMAGRTVPDIATLREICHRGKLERDRRFWYAASRRVSIYITWMLVHTGISANQVTLLTVLLAASGAVLLGMAPASLALCGAGGLLAYHLLDKVDGDIARFRRTYSIVGVYLDEVGHGVAFAGTFLGLGFHLAWQAPTVERAILLLGAGGLGAVCMVLARQHKSAGFMLYTQYVLTQPALKPEPGGEQAPHPLSREGAHRSRRGEAAAAGPALRLLGMARETLLMLADFILVLAMVIAGLIVERTTGDTRFLAAVLVGEAALQALLLVALFWINATTSVRSEILRLDTLVKSQGETSRDD
jgi:phosphatidylglycerophosphate synthase